MRLIAVAMILVSTSALACPNLAGHYAICRSINGYSAGSTDMEVKQTVQNRITTYAVSATNAQTQE